MSLKGQVVGFATVVDFTTGRGQPRVLVVEGTEVHILNSATGKPLTSPMKHPAPVKSVHADSDMPIITLAEDGLVRLWDSRTARPIGPPLGHGGVRKVVLSPDRPTFLTLSDFEARAWNRSHAAASSGSMVMKHGQKLTDAWFAPDSRHVITAAGTEARVWELPKGSPASPVLSHEGPVRYATLTQDGN